MININALDNIIAVVVVILLLSLIVQSIQSVLKKALKIKSRQIEDSLLDLFENVVNFNPPAVESPTSISGKLRAWLQRIFGSSPILRKVYQILTRRPHPNDPSAHPSPDVKKLFDEVIKGFEEIGRVAQTGKRMLDSISKEDLKKVMSKVLPDSLLGGFTAKLTAAFGEITDLESAINTINKNHLGNLSGDANAKFAALQQGLAPLLNDLRSVFAGSSTLVIGSVLHLRDIDLSDVLTTLGEVQKKVAEDLDTAKKATAAAGIIANLQALSDALGQISASLAKLNSRLDEAVAPLRTKLGEVETWYDTVTQSFEERYTRGMKTWAIVISFLVVAYLNASVFEVYKNVVNNDSLRNQLVQVGEERTKANAGAKDKVTKTTEDATKAAEKAKKAKEEADAKANAGTQDATAAKAAKEKADEEKAEADSAAAAATAAEKVTTESIKQDIAEIRKEVAKLSGFGFQPLTWQGVKERFNKDLWFNKGRPDQKEEPDWGGWLSRRRDDFLTLAGWIVMTFLLSVGAPFWEDTLESLFGVKNLLRKGSKTRNVETESGAGQTKP
ncbi:MAG: hypothetical protein AABO57_07260 [Acidobacteriota bacterium]